MDDILKKAINEVVWEINGYIENCPYFDNFSIKEISEGLRAYFARGGKRVRPAIAMWCCGICGGDPKKAIPAAAGLEACHTWTLIHDDIIDNDEKRRGGDSIHIIGRKQAEKNYAFGDFEKYGETYSILIGDMLQGISVSMILDSVQAGVSPLVATEVCRLLEAKTTLHLIEGELLDVQFEYMNMEEINSELIYKMIKGKTGELIRYAACMGSMIGLDTTDTDSEKVKALCDYGLNVGLAFQLCDDILGLCADENKLGKPVGSDIIEGKKTLTVFYALEKMSPKTKEEFLSLFGHECNEKQLAAAVDMIVSSGALERTKKEAVRLTEEALRRLEIFPDSQYKYLL
ncbi:MAG: polyprenyl synthetase family protein, partial [Armatimonadetes bacterium]|nr:polyprenyl synthetase family protein [Candidatus Hippobium faecium]